MRELTMKVDQQCRALDQERPKSWIRAFQQPYLQDSMVSHVIGSVHGLKTSQLKPDLIKHAVHKTFLKCLGPRYIFESILLGF